MTKHFELRSGPSPAFPLVSFSLDSVRPEEYLRTLEKQLQSKKYRGPVLIDLLASNGPSSRRFVVGEFDGNRLRAASMRPVKAEALDEATRYYCESFYSQHGRLDRSIMSPTGKERYKLTVLTSA